jgi:V-type H+-transporting ATPase subunit G
VKEIKEAGGEKGSKVVDDLLKAVTDVKPEVPYRVAAPSA